jgi:hypothetical protein
MGVHVTVRNQARDGGERLIVHLYNNINTAGGHALPNDDVPLREEAVQIAKIEVEFRDGPKIRSVRQQPENIELPINQSRGRASVKVPILDVHTMIVAERNGR